jgi:photosystem II stability/assembly factor-like uncharacterized protein
MSDDFTIGIGTVGAGMWFSYDSGGAWRHIYKFVNPEGNVRAVRVDPSDPKHILAASDRAGLFQSEDGGYRWFPLASPIKDCDIWTLTVDPTDPDRIYVGTRPGVWRSTDRGESWEQLDMGMNPECPIGISRTTDGVVDPRDSKILWAGIEVDGVYRSNDGGDSWTHLDDIGPSPFHGDVHGLAVRDHDGGTDVFASTPFGLGTSTDDGASFTWQEFGGFEKGSGNPYAYCRGVFVSPEDPDTVLVGCGDYIPGAVGAIEVSRDGGRSFTRAPVESNSTMYWMAMHPDVPGVIAASSVFGQIFLSRDRGDSWSKVDREFGEIRSITLSPT